MRIAHLNTARDWRGGEQQLLLLMRGLAASGDDIQQTLFAPPGAPLTARAADAGFEVRPLAVRSSADVFASRRLRKQLRASPFDLLHLHTAHAHSVGLRGARWLGSQRPAVVVSRHVSYSIYRHFPWHLTWFKYTRGVARIICVADAVRAALRSNRLPAELLTVIPNGVDPEAWQPSAEGAARCRRELGIAADALLVGSVAALTAEKNHAALIEAFALLDPARSGAQLVIVGDGPLHADLSAHARRLGIAAHVHLPGFQEDVRSWLSAFDVFVFPSRKEGMPMTVLQAMAAGRAVLASRAGGIPEIVQDGASGVLVPVDDGAALAAALADLVDDAPLRAALGAAAVQRVQAAFDFRDTARRTLAVYREVVPGAAASAV